MYFTGIPINQHRNSVNPVEGCCDDCDEELSGIGSIFKKIGSVAAGFIPVVGGAVSGMIDSIGSNPDMDKKCAKKPNDKKCVPYLQAKRDAQAQADAQKAQQQAAIDATNKQTALLEQLASKQNEESASSGMDTTTLLMIGGGALAVMFLMKR